jgi:hypothetical protein
MTFVHQALLGAMLLTLIPLLIHVINLVRQQRVQWAAMEFLLASYRRHRRWIWLRQFLLLFLRMALVAVIVLMCAQWVSHEQWLSLFGGRVVHHYILIDDSYSMSQQTAGRSPFERAIQFVQQLADDMAQLESEHRLTVLRVSRLRASNAAETSVALQIGRQADWQGETIHAELVRQLEPALRKFSVSETACHPTEGLEALAAFIDPAETENRVVYVLSDFRQHDWETPALAREKLATLQQAGCELHFVDCSSDEEANLAVVDLATSADTRAAGVPLFAEVQVKNQGREVARRVNVQLRSFTWPKTTNESETAQPQRDDLPLVVIDQLQPGEVASRRVQLYFPQAGEHLVTAELPTDAITADDRRQLVVPVPDGERVLVIDGSVEQQHAYYLTAAFRPLQRSNTGILAETKPVSFLRDASLDALRPYTSIYLCAVPRLDPQAREVISQYLQAGGGVAVFLGEEVDFTAYNAELFADGAGWLPARLERSSQMDANRDPAAPDFTVGDHPLFSFFRGERNSFLSGVTIERYFPQQLQDDQESQVVAEVLAELRGGVPFFTARAVGKGRVVLCGTTLAPLWNDWARNPSFVVMILRLQSYLASGVRDTPSLTVGESLSLNWESAQFFPEATFVSQRDPAQTPLTTELTGALSSDRAQVQLVSPGLEHAGVVEVRRTRLTGETVSQRWAVNVSPHEAALARVESALLLASLAPLRIDWHRADESGYLAARQAGYNRSQLLMFVLLALLIAEQGLAYLSSYHPTAVVGVKR